MALCYETTNSLSYKLRNLINILAWTTTMLGIKEMSRFVDNSREVCAAARGNDTEFETKWTVADSRYLHGEV